MSADTDALGKAMGLSLRDYSGPELQAAFTAIHETLGTSLVANILQSGLLAVRNHITLEEWDASSKAIRKAIKSISVDKKPTPPKKQPKATPMDVDEPQSLDIQPIRIFEPFHPDYIPSELVSNIFTFMDAKSHGEFETCNKRLLIISRNPSSNLYFGDDFENYAYAYENLGPYECPAVQWAGRLKATDNFGHIMSKAHRFRLLKGLSLCLYVDGEVFENTPSHTLDEAMFSLLSSASKNVEDLIIKGEFHDYRSQVENTFRNSLSSDDVPVLPKLTRLRQVFVISFPSIFFPPPSFFFFFLPRTKNNNKKKQNSKRSPQVFLAS